MTGGGRGIGRGIAEILVRRGYQVVITDVDGDAARRTAEQIGAVAGLRQDVREEASHRAVAEEAKRHGRLAAWFNNAGGAAADLVGSNCVIRSVPAWRAVLMRLTSLTPSVSMKAERFFIWEGRRRMQKQA